MPDRQLYFDESPAQGDQALQLVGADLETHGLELSRVTALSTGQQSFHALEWIQATAWPQSMTVGSDIPAHLRAFLHSLSKLTSEDIADDTLDLLKAVVHLGRIGFDSKADGSSSVIVKGHSDGHESSSLEIASHNLGIDQKELSGMLTKAKLPIPGDIRPTIKYLSVKEAEAARNGLMVSIYECVVDVSTPALILAWADESRWSSRPSRSV